MGCILVLHSRCTVTLVAPGKFISNWIRFVAEFSLLSKTPAVLFCRKPKDTLRTLVKKLLYVIRRSFSAFSLPSSIVIGFSVFVHANGIEIYIVPRTSHMINPMCVLRFQQPSNIASRRLHCNATWQAVQQCSRRPYRIAHAEGPSVCLYILRFYEIWCFGGGEV